MASTSSLLQIFETTAAKADYEHTRAGRQLLLAYATDSRSGHVPGAIVGAAVGPVGGGIAVARAAAEATYDHHRSSAMRDVDRAAKQVVEYRAKYMAKQGWL